MKYGTIVGIHTVHTYISYHDPCEEALKRIYFVCKKESVVLDSISGPSPKA